VVKYIATGYLHNFRLVVFRQSNFNNFLRISQHNGFAIERMCIDLNTEEYKVLFHIS
jgi:hypothetical protein